MTNLSILIPIFNNEKEILYAYEQTKAVLLKLNMSYEIIFIDDGSRDGSFNSLKKLYQQDKHICVIRLAHNYGQNAALTMALKHTLAEIIITMDVDLACHPEEIPRFITQIEGGYDFVSGWRIHRQAPFLSRKIPSLIMNKTVRKLSGIKLHDYGCGMNALNQHVAKQLKKQHQNQGTFLKPLIASLSKKTKELKIKERATRQSKSKYSILKLTKLMFNLTLSLSNLSPQKPLVTCEVKTILQMNQDNQRSSL